MEIFDRRRKACLYLTYFLNGDTRGRGMALVGFKEEYQRVGFTLDSGELPDFLPVVLEFGAVGDLDAALQILGRHRAGLELLHHALDGFGLAVRRRRRRAPPRRPRRHRGAEGGRAGCERPADRDGRTHPVHPRRVVASGSPDMTAIQTFLWVVLPYVATAVVRRRDVLALPLRPVRLDDPVVADVRVAAAAHRKPAVPLRHPHGARRAHPRSARAGGLDRGRRRQRARLPRGGGRVRCRRGSDGGVWPGDPRSTADVRSAGSSR